MSGDEADPELLELLRQTLGLSGASSDEVSPDTKVLRDAEFINNNAIDVSVDMFATKAAAVSIYRGMQDRGYSTATWGQHELHPTRADGFTEVDIVNFVFTMDLLNFSFWSELPEQDRYQVEYRGKRWTGYNSLVACLRRALDEGIPITTPRFWRSRQCSDEVLSSVFRSATAEPIALLDERIMLLREASAILRTDFANGDRDVDSDSGDDDTADVNAQEVLKNVTDQDHASTSVVAASVETPTQPDTSAVLGSQAQQDLPPPPTAAENNHDLPVTSAAMDGHLPDSNEDDNDNKVSAAQSTIGAADVAPGSGTATVPPPQSQPTDETSTEPKNTNMGVGAASPDHLQSRTTVGPDLAVVRLVERASRSAGVLVNLLAKHFPGFRDESRFEGKKVRLLKRAQIFVADLWAALNGTGCGEFHDIDHLTMFADYRVPQMLHSLGVIRYSPPLEYHVRAERRLEPGHSWEVQLRGCSIWAIELIQREIRRAHADAVVNAVLIDFFLYDLAKERERSGVPVLPHHRVRTQWY